MASKRNDLILKEPAFVNELFGSVRFAWLWTVVRIWLGWQWLTAGLGKVQSPGWTGGGAALKGFWTGAVQVPESGSPAITYDWYRTFLASLLDGGHYTWFAPLVAWGELLIGIGLIIGAFTGFAAFAGALMNFSFMLAGVASTNPVLFLAAFLLIVAWKTAGWIGADRWLLPSIGTPWAVGAWKLGSRSPDLSS